MSLDSLIEAIRSSPCAVIKVGKDRENFIGISSSQLGTRIAVVMVIDGKTQMIESPDLPRKYWPYAAQRLVSPNEPVQSSDVMRQWG